MSMLAGMSRMGRLESFVGEVIDLHNDEFKEKTMWEIWLNRIFNKSYQDFMDEINGTEQPTQEQTANIVTESKNMLLSFKPE